MFSDLVGSTALSARMDPEDLREVISAYQKCVAEIVGRFGGFVAKYMGDGVLVYFGFPRAHEDDAERAVRAGIDMIAAVGRLGTSAGTLEVRIGIATGLVVVGDLIGEGASREQAVVGETPNLAARLQALAQPGGIVLPPATRQLLGNRFTLRNLGRHAVKGIADPVEVWAVDGISVSESRFESVRVGRLTGFVGREHEIGLLMERWHLAQDGEGQVVLLSGEPGIGKSRILSELRARLETHHPASLRFHCSPYYVNSAFYPVIDNFERALQFGREETSEGKLDKLEALLVNHYRRPREDVRFIAAMLSILSEARYGAVTMTPQKFKDETLRALVDTVEAMARQQPTVMLFEDAHWADPTTLETMDLLIHRVWNIPLLVVITHRPEFAPRWSHYGHVATLSLTKLTRAQSAAMVSRLADGKALPTDLLEQILLKTDGVPLFVEELTKSILELLWTNVATTGRFAESLRWVTEILDAAEAYHDPNSPDRRAHRSPDLLFLARRADQSPRSRRPGAGAVYRRAAWPSGGHPQPRPENTEFDVYGPFDLDARLPQASRDDQRRQGCPCAPARASFRPGLGADSRRYRLRSSQ